MQVHNVVLARSLQSARSPSGAIGYIPDIIQELRERYGFLIVPKEEDLLPSDPPKGVDFRHGRVVMPDGQKIIIDRLSVFTDGLVADTASSTDDSDLFLTDLLDWAKTALPKAVAEGPRYYLSNLEVILDRPLAQYLSTFRALGDKVSSRLEEYGIETPSYEPSSINLHYDLYGKPSPQPGPLTIERRANVPYSQNIWFTQAPLKTADHIELLRQLERI